MTAAKKPADLSARAVANGRVSRSAVVLQALQDAGPRGMLTVQVADVAEILANNCASLLADLESAGKLGSWPDPIGPLLNRRRWWALDFKPLRQPPPSGEAARVHKQRKPGVSKSSQFRRKAAGLPPLAGLQPLQVQAAGMGWRDFGPAAGKGGDVKLPHASGAAPGAPAAPRKVQVQRCPGWTHDPRYQVAPGTPVQGAGFAAAGVGRDAITGKPWGCR